MKESKREKKVNNSISSFIILPFSKKVKYMYISIETIKSSLLAIDFGKEMML